MKASTSRQCMFYLVLAIGIGGQLAADPLLKNQVNCNAKHTSARTATPVLFSREILVSALLTISEVAAQRAKRSDLLATDGNTPQNNPEQEEDSPAPDTVAANPQWSGSAAGQWQSFSASY